MQTEALVTKNTYAGLFMVTLATLMYEILLTRIFSVTMWYHFGFMAVSIALFGMTVGAVLVYVFPSYFTQERAMYQLALHTLLFAVSIVVSFLTQLSIPFAPDRSIVGLYSLTLTYVVIAVPFVFSGICVCLALTKFPERVSRLYAADLAGAALGCVLLIYALRITDGPTAVILVAFLASIGAVFFGFDGGRGRLLQIALLSSALLATFTAAHTVLVDKQSPLLRVMWVRGQLEPRPLYEKWNSFSRIRVWRSRNRPEKPFGWGISPTYPSDRQVSQLSMNIDAYAYTVMTSFDGDLDRLVHLKYDVTNMVHYIRHDSRVLVIGSGGGRDVLSALVFGQKSVLGVEINRDIIDAVNRVFGDFTGHLDRDPKVSFVHDEARSFVARSSDRFDIIQASLIDTWAATTAGAFVLTENSLYTLEAWKVFLDHLSPRGILTFSHWYFRDSPGGIYRLTSLASSALVQQGVRDPRGHIVIVRRMRQEGGRETPHGVGTILVGRAPFSDRELDIIEEVADQLQFEVVLSPRFSLDSTFATLASGRNIGAFAAGFPINIAPPTDDNPFFFHMLRLRDVFNRELLAQGANSFNMQAIFVLGALLIIVVGLAALFIIVPLILTADKSSVRGAWPLFVFFSSIGLGFMLVEISQMQRLIVFLGHPTYGLSVVLFALLLSSGLGSYTTARVGDPTRESSASIRMLLLVCALMVFGILTPHAIVAFHGSVTFVRILIAVLMLFPLGLFMGMAFPLGMKVAHTRSASLTPWLWAINGATSVCASVLAVAIALSSGISTSFWTGVGCYVIAVVAFAWARSKERLRIPLATGSVTEGGQT